MKLLGSISPVISLASIFIMSFGFYGFIQCVFSCLAVVPCYDMKLPINGKMRSTVVIFITLDGKKLSSTSIDSFGLILVLFGIILVGLLICTAFIPRRI
jgi:hypothetical protein